MMAQDPKAALRAKLSFEQQARFDAQYDRQAKKQGPATVLSLPVLGTFGLEQFYLGNVGSGIIRILFSWTLIPTVLALFEVLSGDLKKQVAHANARVAKRVYDEVLTNSPTAASAPAAVMDSVITPSAVAEAAAFAAEVPIAPTMSDPGSLALPFSPTDVANDAALATATPEEVSEVAAVVVTTPATDAPTATASAAPATPAVTESAEIDTEDRQEDVATTTIGAFTVSESAAVWQQGMDAPVVTSDEQTFTVGADTDTATDTGPTTTAFVAEEAAPAPAASVAQPDLDAEPLATAAPTTDDAATAPLAEEGVLVFVADEEPLSSETVMSTTMTTPDEIVSETVTQDIAQQQQTDQVAIAEAEHVESQHFHHGKLVEASRHDIKLTGEVNSLLTDTTTDTLLQEVESRSTHAPGWIDVSPLQDGDAATLSTDTAAPMSDTSNSTPSVDTAAPVSDSSSPTPSSSASTVPTVPASDTPTATQPSSDVTPTTSTDVANNLGADAPLAALESPPIREPDGPTDGTVAGSGTAPASGTDVPGGGLGGPATDVPGGAISDPGSDPGSDIGTNVPSGDIGSPTTDGGDPGTPSSVDGPPVHTPRDGETPV